MSAALQNDLPTLPLPAKPARPAPPARRLPPPLPRPVSGSFEKPLAPALPRALGKATLVFELPVQDLAESEIDELEVWLTSRPNTLVIRRSSRWRLAMGVIVRIPSRVRARLVGGARRFLSWALSRLKED